MASESVEDPRTRVRLVGVAVAALAYLGAAVWVTRGVWAEPSALLLGFPEASPVAQLVRTDQAMVLAVVSGNAHRLLHHPGEVLEKGQCHPFPRPLTLGEHMLGASLLAAVPLEITGDPIVAYNVLVVLTLWIPAMAMFALCSDLTRSLPGSFVAGALFGFSRLRLSDPAHPFGHGDLWTPLALLFLYRLFTRRTWGSALGLAVFGLLSLGESIYPVVAAAVLLGSSAAFLAVGHRRHLLSLAPKLALCGLAAAAGAWLILGPYLETAEIWQTLGDRPALLAIPASYTFGDEYYPGTILVGLALVGLADRLRGPRRPGGGDARAALVVVVFLLFWYTVSKLPLPGTSIEIPSLYGMLRQIVPGLDAARVPTATRCGLYLALCALAGYGGAALFERLAPRWAVPLAAVLSLGALVEVTEPAVARASFGSPIPHRPYRAAPPASHRALLQHIDGPVLDYPPMANVFEAEGHYLTQAAYHRQPTAACYNSMPSPLDAQVTRLASGIPDPDALEALAALGFENLLVHRHSMPWLARVSFRRGRKRDRMSGDHLLPVAQTADHWLYRLVGRAATSDDLDLLVPDAAGDPTTVQIRDHAALSFPVRNEGPRTFRHPDPIEPTPIVATWYDAAGRRVREDSLRAVLPIAIAPGASMSWPVSLPIESVPGRYRVTVALANAPTRVLGHIDVIVAPPETGG